MKKLILFFFLTLAVLLFVTCNDPIFYIISLEEKILKPKIQGSPTNFVVFDGKMYVASGDSLYRYNGTDPGHNGRGLWDEIIPGGRILSLAETSINLFILCEESGKNVIKKCLVGSTNWSNVNLGVDNIQSIFSTNDQLFIGAGDFGSFIILNADNNGNNSKELVDARRKILNGAAYNKSTGIYYLSTKDMRHEVDGSIYSSDLTEAGTIAIRNDTPFVGIININSNSIAAIDNNGVLYSIPSLSEIAKFDGHLATGALAIWENKLLLAGRQNKLESSVNSGYTYGYLELEIGKSEFREPGKNTPSTIIDGENGRYISTIGKCPVNHIFQAPDGVLFASTQKNGVWSYRQREDVWHWNAEQ